VALGSRGGTSAVAAHVVYRVESSGVTVAGGDVYPRTVTQDLAPLLQILRHVFSSGGGVAIIVSPQFGRGRPTFAAQRVYDAARRAPDFLRHELVVRLRRIIEHPAEEILQLALGEAMQILTRLLPDLAPPLAIYHLLREAGWLGDVVNMAGYARTEDEVGIAAQAMARHAAEAVVARVEALGVAALRTGISRAVSGGGTGGPGGPGGSGGPGGGGRRNVYPDFERVPPGLQSTAQQQAGRLQQQLGIPVPPDRVLMAPWIGRIGSTGSTSLGWLRNAGRFWNAFRQAFPQDAAALGGGTRVTPAFARRMGWVDSNGNPMFVGQTLIHHHIDNGPLVFPVPSSLHRGSTGTIHGTVDLNP
jgi:hypothetical protein